SAAARSRSIPCSAAAVLLLNAPTSSSSATRSRFSTPSARSSRTAWNSVTASSETSAISSSHSIRPVLLPVLTAKGERTLSCRVLGSLRPCHFVLDAHGDAVLAASDLRFEQRGGAAAQAHVGARRGVEDNAAAGLERHHLGEAHGLFVQHHVEVHRGVPQL